MRRTRIRSYSLSLLAVLALAGSAAAQAPEEFRWQGAIAAGRTLEIVGINGEIVASPAAEGAAQVVATRRGRDDDPASVRIEVVEDEDGVTICAVYPGTGGEAAGEGCRGNRDTEDSDVVVEFAVRVPAGVHLAARTVNGRIEASGLGGDVRAETVNGRVEVSGSGVVEARTVNGGIEASMGAGSWAGELAFRTVNGSITVRLPEGAGAAVEAHTVNGSLASDFPLTIAAEQEWGPKRMTGTIGAGGGSIDLETVNGSIEIRRG